jgi:hypothetical protein
MNINLRFREAGTRPAFALTGPLSPQRRIAPVRKLQAVYRPNMNCCGKTRQRHLAFYSAHLPEVILEDKIPKERCTSGAHF